MADYNLKMDCLIIAQDIAPKDTGNLAFNGIHINDLANGFVIQYRSEIAPYVGYLEDGTKFFNKHEGFISDKTTKAIMSYLNSYYNGGDTNLNDTKERISQLARDNPARQDRFLKSLRNVEEV